MTDINPTKIAEERLPTLDSTLTYTGYTDGERIGYALAITERELPLRERIAELEARLTILEGKGGEPWNGHTDLPWRLAYFGIYPEGNKPIIAQFDNKGGVFTNWKDDSEFVLHACNSYYPTQAHLRSLTEAAQVAADAVVELAKNREGVGCAVHALSLLSQNGVVPGGG
jgi:hypothetical protein